MIVVFAQGTVEVVDGRIRVSSGPEASRAVLGALRGHYVDEGTPEIEDDGTIVEGEIRKLRKGTDEHTLAALRSLPEAVIVDT